MDQRRTRSTNRHQPGHHRRTEEGGGRLTTIRNLTDGPLGETDLEPLERGLAFSALTEVEDQLLAVFTNLREAQPHKAPMVNMCPSTPVRQA